MSHVTENIMPIFDQATNLNKSLREAQLQTIIKYIISLRKAAVEEKFTTRDCWSVLHFLHNRKDKPISSFPKAQELLDIIKATNTEEIIFIESEKLIDDLQWFESTQGEYFDLIHLSITNPHSIEEHLFSFLFFYIVFIQFTNYDPETMIASCNTNEMKKECGRWEKQRKAPAKTDAQLYSENHDSLVAKFKARGNVSPNEWLTDTDITKSFNFLGLSDLNPNICPISSTNIGMSIHFQRIAHENDNPKRPYTIPLILNHNGAHWTRMLIIVTPQDNQEPIIKIKYTDTIGHAPNNIDEALIRQALQYNETELDYTTGNEVHFIAFPNAIIEPIQIEGTNEQHDGYSCGYRALQGLLKDLRAAQFINQLTPTQESYLACNTSRQLRDFIFQQFQVPIPADAAPAAHAFSRARPYQAAQITKKGPPLKEEGFKKHLNELTNRLILTHGKKIFNDIELLLTLKKTELSTKMLIDVLLFLQYKAYRKEKKSIIVARLKHQLQQLVSKINELENQELSQTLLSIVRDSHHQHVLKLSEHWTDHEAIKNDYLTQLMVEWFNFSSINGMIAWKNDIAFQTWWADQKEPDAPSAMNNQIKLWLSKYNKPKWLFNISDDRQNLTKNLISKIESIGNPATHDAILDIIHFGLKNILMSDGYRDRPIKKSFQDPLYQFLNQLEARVYSMMSPEEMSRTVQHELRMIKMTLSEFERRGNQAEALQKIIQKINPEIARISIEEIEKQYSAISAFFRQIQLDAIINSKLTKDNHFLGLLTYCQEKQEKLPNYFKQCAELKFLAEVRYICPPPPIEPPSLLSEFYSALTDFFNLIISKVKEFFIGDDTPICHNVPISQPIEYIYEPMTKKEPTNSEEEIDEPAQMKKLFAKALSMPIEEIKYSKKKKITETEMKTYLAAPQETEDSANSDDVTISIRL